MDGFSVAERIREHDQVAGASIMMLTSSARPGDRARCLELGVASYVSKPIKRSDLFDTIADVLLDAPLRERLGRGALRWAGSLNWDTVAYRILSALADQIPGGGQPGQAASVSR
jgi:CheY-like chemotaxis protein